MTQAKGILSFITIFLLIISLAGCCTTKPVVDCPEKETVIEYVDKPVYITTGLDACSDEIELILSTLEPLDNRYHPGHPINLEINERNMKKLLEDRDRYKRILDCYEAQVKASQEATNATRR